MKRINKRIGNPSKKYIKYIGNHIVFTKKSIKINHRVKQIHTPEEIYKGLYNITQPMKCVCGNPLHFINISQGYSINCKGPKCRGIDVFKLDDFNQEYKRNPISALESIISNYTWVKMLNQSIHRRSILKKININDQYIDIPISIKLYNYITYNFNICQECGIIYYLDYKITNSISKYCSIKCSQQWKRDSITYSDNQIKNMNIWYNNDNNKETIKHRNLKISESTKEYYKSLSERALKDRTEKCTLARTEKCQFSYGYAHFSQVPHIKEQSAKNRIETNNKLHGGNSPQANPKVREKKDKTNLIKYGSKSPLGSIEVKYKIRKIMESKGSWIKEEDLIDLERYRKLSWMFTNKSISTHSLINEEFRGPVGVEGSFHLDHMYSIKQGFKDGVLPYIIGSLPNLKYIPWKENLMKGAACSITLEELYLSL